MNIEDKMNNVIMGRKEVENGTVVEKEVMKTK